MYSSHSVLLYEILTFLQQNYVNFKTISLLCSLILFDFVSVINKIFKTDKKTNFLSFMNFIVCVFTHSKNGTEKFKNTDRWYYIVYTEILFRFFLIFSIFLSFFNIKTLERDSHNSSKFSQNSSGQTFFSIQSR